MEIFTRLNRKSIDDRQIDTLIGLSKGILADGKVNQSEAEFLLTWLIQARTSSENPMILNLLDRVSAMLQDGELDEEESHELMRLLQQISGGEVALGELAKPSTLPLNDPMPPVAFSGSTFLYTGTFVYGTRRQCEDATASLGGINAKGVTRTLHYLVLGSYVTDSWVHETYGRKIEKAMTYRAVGLPIAIISEEHWASAGGFF